MKNEVPMNLMVRLKCQCVHGNADFKVQKVSTDRKLNRLGNNEMYTVYYMCERACEMCHTNVHLHTHTHIEI